MAGISHLDAHTAGEFIAPDDGTNDVVMRPARDTAGCIIDRLGPTPFDPAILVGQLQLGFDLIIVAGAA